MDYRQPSRGLKVDIRHVALLTAMDSKLPSGYHKTASRFPVWEVLLIFLVVHGWWGQSVSQWFFSQLTYIKAGRIDLWLFNLKYTAYER